MTISNRTGRSLRGAAMALILTVGMAGAAQAQTDAAIRVNADGQLATLSQVVSTDDLNTASAAGQKRLDLRLRVAARTVCQDSGMWGLRPPADYVRCYDSAIADARSQAGRAGVQQTGGGSVHVTAR